VLSEAVELLERIATGRADGLLDAIADGAFGVTKRPATGGKGLDGVAEHADDYYNPALDILEEGSTRCPRPRPLTGHRPSRASSGRTATPPATAWSSCRSPCPCRTTPAPRPPPRR
jgi:hypothetical protein